MVADVAPQPYGKLTPSLTGSYNYNTEHTPPDWIILCPNCNSDNVCCLDPKFNPELDGEVRWFCISCQDSWECHLDI